MSDDKSAFFDTNILVYLASEDLIKANISEGILKQGGSISTQVLNELVNVLRTKRRRSWPEIRLFLTLTRPLVDVYPVTISVHDRGVQLAETHGFHIYDAMIVAAALEADCSTLWSEDMQDGMVIDGRLTIRNPYLAPV